MKKEDKVISLELAKEIYKEHKRLGIEVESEWWWANYCIDYKYEDLCCDYIRSFVGYRLIEAKPLIIEDLGLEEDNEREPEDCIIYPAYDVAELGEMLPKELDVKGRYNGEYLLELYFHGNDGWSANYLLDTPYDGGYYLLQWGEIIETVEAEARGRLYLWLLKEGYIK